MYRSFDFYDLMLYFSDIELKITELLKGNIMKFQKNLYQVPGLVLFAVLLAGCGKNLDKQRIAVDESKGIYFSENKQTLEKYNEKLSEKEYATPSGLTAIGARAFEKCSKLTNVTISDGVISIGERAFLKCGRLTTVAIPASVSTIDDYAFEDCTDLTSAVIPGRVTILRK